VIPSQFENALLALTVWREEPEGLINLHIALAKVFENRTKAGWHGGDFFKNLTVVARNRPSPWHAKFPEGLNEPGFQQLLQLVENLPSLPDSTDGALYYVRDDESVEAVRDCQRTSQVGRFLFFK
jgi:hypothetical protein